MNLRFLLLALLAALLVFSQEAAEANPEKDTQVKEEVEVILVASPHVSTAFVFPEFPNRAFILGKEVEVLVGFSNIGDSAVNVTSISASLRYPSDWRYFIQNYTQEVVSFVVNPKEQATFLYTFLPDPMLEARDFGLAAQVFYHDQEGNNFTSYFYNSTISLVESSESIDAQALFTYVGIVGVAGLLLFVITRPSETRRRERDPPELRLGPRAQI